MRLERYSEPYHATGGLAAEGVLNQLGRPDIEPLEVLVREAVQNCWDAKRRDERGIRVDDRTTTPRPRRARRRVRRSILADPPPGLPLGDELRPGHGDPVFRGLRHRRSGRTDTSRPRRPGTAARLRRLRPQHRAAARQGTRRRLVRLRQGGVLHREPRPDDHRRHALPNGRRTLRAAAHRRAPWARISQSPAAPFTGRHWWGAWSTACPSPCSTRRPHGRRTDARPARSAAGHAGLGTTVAIIAPGVAPEAPGEVPTRRWRSSPKRWSGTSGRA